MQRGAGGLLINKVCREGAWTTTSPPSPSATRVEVPPTSSLQLLGFSLWRSWSSCARRGHLGWPPCEGSWRWSHEGGLGPDRRDLGATEEQDEGSIGRSPNLSFEESESFFSNGQPV